MRGVLLGVLIFLLISAVFVGAANEVLETNNRPYTLYEFVQEVSQLNFGIDNVTGMIDHIRGIWSDGIVNDEFYGRDKNGDGKLDKSELDLDGDGWITAFEADIDGDGIMNGSEVQSMLLGYNLGTSSSPVDDILRILSTIYEIVVFVFNFVFDVIKLVADILELALNFITGKPIAA